MNERIKELRKALNLSGEKFGEALGVKSPAIYKLENGTTTLTDQMIKLICLTYNVSENWLRNGEGSMFNRTKVTFLNELQECYSLTDFQVDIVKMYLELDDKDRDSIDKFITLCHQNANNNKI